VNCLQVLQPQSNSYFSELGHQTISKIQLCPPGCQPSAEWIPDEGDRALQKAERLERGLQECRTLARQILESETSQANSIIPFPKQDSGNGNSPVRQPEIWTNQHVLFCSAKVDDAKIPYKPFRILLDLKRRIGRRCDKNSNINPGIDAIARTCRMNRQSVIDALRWLKKHGYINIIPGKNGVHHHYHMLVPDKDLYIDPRLDDAGFSPAEIRVLAHISRLSDDIGLFFINPLKFARICCMARNTVKAVLDRLKDKELIKAYDYRKNPMWCFHLCDFYPRYEGRVVKNEER
jgi:DNA-binding MarR family transcriptional regulator